MSQSSPFYGKLLKSWNACLIIGAILILCSLGVVKVGTWFEFRPFEDIPVLARLVLLMVGILLLLGGVTLLLYREGVWRPRLGMLYFTSSVFLLIAFGIVIVVRGPTEHIEEGDLVTKWYAGPSSFEVNLLMDRLEQYQENHNLLLICRREDKRIDFEDDTKLEKSRLFSIERGVKELQVDFSPEFSKTLKPRDEVECAICLVPKNVSRDSIRTLSDVESYGGKILETVSHHVGR